MILLNYVKLLRIKHYIKNLLIFLPLLCSGGLISSPCEWVGLLVGFFAFSFMSSAIYLINDIRDRENDAQHPKKCHRPIASGTVGILHASFLSLLLCVAALVMAVYLSGATSWMVLVVLVVYLILNIGYSVYLKHIPVIEVAILASGFLLRVLYGGFVSGIEVSSWLYLTVLSFSFYMGLGKRRNEFDRNPAHDTRMVLKHYSRRFLDRNMYMFLALSICFYSLWAMEQGRWALWSVPIVIVCSMRYSLIVEGSSDGDPVEVLLGDKFLLLLGAIYALYMVVFRYAV